MASINVVQVSLSADDVFQETSARYRAVEPSSGSNVIPRRARPGLAGLRPHSCSAQARVLSGGGACCCPCWSCWSGFYESDTAASFPIESWRHNAWPLGQPEIGSSRASSCTYRGTSLIRNSAPPGPYSGTLHRALWRS